MNDQFQAYNIFDESTNTYKCPRFVKNVEFYVYDRYGKEVYNDFDQSEKRILINWNGTNNSGKEMPSGIYYYLAKVTFDVLDKEEQNAEFRGWINLLK